MGKDAVKTGGNSDFQVSGKGTKKLLDRLNWKSKIFDERGCL